MVVYFTQIPIAIPPNTGTNFATADLITLADEATLKKMNENQQILFRYCDENGNVTEETNPNGTTENIAGVCNATKNVFGMMPHPERAADKELSNEDGMLLFQSLLKNYDLVKG